MASAAQIQCPSLTMLVLSELMDKGKRKELIQANWTENPFPEIQSHLFTDLRQTVTAIILLQV